MTDQNYWSREWLRVLATLFLTQDVRVLTIWQPRASFFTMGFRQFETRGAPEKYRGKILIHAAKRIPTKDDADLWAQALLLSSIDPQTAIQGVFPSSLGAILAICDLTDCKLIDSELIAEQSELELLVGNWQLGRFALKLENIILPPDPIPYSNGQGLQHLQIHKLPSFEEPKLN